MWSPDLTIAHLASAVIKKLQIEEPSVKVEAQDVGSDFKLMYNNPEFSDVRFICKDGVINAHKVVLASRCERFRAMFSRFRESQQNEIHLEDIEYDTLLLVMEWIYTGTASVTRRNAVNLLIISNMYGLKELKSRCEFFLWHYIDIENVIDLYTTATLHQAPQLSQVSEEFIIRNFSKLSSTNSYQNLPAEMKATLQINMKKKGANFETNSPAIPTGYEDSQTDLKLSDTIDLFR